MTCSSIQEENEKNFHNDTPTYKKKIADLELLLVRWSHNNLHLTKTKPNKK